MHIIAGQRRGAQLVAPKGMDTRPTQAKVKESLFNIIQAYVPEARVLDLFAGSGNLALEALSRGAQHAVMVDMDREAAACIRKNVDKLRFENCTSLYKCDWRQAVAQLKTTAQPFRMLELNEMCAALADGGLLADEAMLVLEHRTGEFGRPDKRFAEWKERTYADTQIHFYLYDSREEEG